MEDFKLIVLDNCKELGNKVNEHLKKIHGGRNYILSISNSRFSNGEGKIKLEEMRKAQKDTEEQYKKYMAQKEKEEEEKMRKKDEPYKGMKEKYINITLMGRAKEKRTEHYWRDTPGKRTQDIQYRYMWYNSNGAKKFMAVCRNGRVSSVVEFVSSTTSGKKTYRGNTSRNNDRKDMYDVQDYDDPEDFYYDHADEFDDIQDAEDYWEEAQ